MAVSLLALAGCGGEVPSSLSYRSAAVKRQIAAVDDVAARERAAVSKATMDQLIVLRLYQSVHGKAPSHAEWVYWSGQAATSGLAPLARRMLQMAGTDTLPDSDLASRVLLNMKLSAKLAIPEDSLNILLSALTQLFNVYGRESRGQIVLNLSALLPGLTNDPTWGAAARAFNRQVEANYVYSRTPQNSTAGAPSFEEPWAQWSMQLPDASKFYPACVAATAMPTLEFGDLNRDGRLDIVAHYWCSDWSGKGPFDPVTRNSLVVYLSQPDGTYLIGNSTLFPNVNLVDLGGTSRRFAKADYNGDGYLDFAVAINMEDGRKSFKVPFSEWTAQAAFIMSNGDGTYRIDRVDPRVYYHNVTTFQYAPGKFEAVFQSDPTVNDGDSPAVTIRYVNGQPTRVDGHRSYAGATLQALTPAPDETGTTRSVAVTSWHSLEFNMKRLNAEGKLAWTREQLVDFPSDPVTKLFPLLGRQFKEIRFWESRLCRLSPGAEDVVAFLADTNNDSQFQPLLFYGTAGNRLRPLESVLVDDNPTMNTANYSCQDIDGDGYDDFFMARKKNWTYGGMSVIEPRIHLNNRRNQWIPADAPGLPPLAEFLAGAYLQDLDQDGIPDLIYFAKETKDGTGKLISPNIVIHWGVRTMANPADRLK